MDTPTILHLYTFQRGYISMLVDDIPDNQFSHQPKGFPNHPAWQIGHLAWAADGLCQLLGGPPGFNQVWTDTYGMNTIPVADRGAYPPKADLIAMLDDRRTNAATLLHAATPQFLAQPNPLERLAPMLPTRGHMALFLAIFHESTHLGQLSSWRKLAGMPEALSKFER